jgi:hypothetical protein
MRVLLDKARHLLSQSTWILPERKSERVEQARPVPRLWHNSALDNYWRCVNILRPVTLVQLLIAVKMVVPLRTKMNALLCSMRAVATVARGAGGLTGRLTANLGSHKQVTLCLRWLCATV